MIPKCLSPRGSVESRPNLLGIENSYRTCVILGPWPSLATLRIKEELSLQEVIAIILGIFLRGPRPIQEVKDIFGEKEIGSQLIPY